MERKIPRLVFLMHEDHDVEAKDVEKGEGAVRLDALKKRLEEERVVNYFRSPADLRARVIDSLSRLRTPDLTALDYVSDIPAPPEPYIAHPYTLLQTKELIGRQAELNLLTDWVTKRGADVYGVRVLNVVAIGGMGKSALTWKWFNEVAPLEMAPLAGRMWWSFYESDARFENFVVRALAYVTGRAREDIEENIQPGQREDMLLGVLDREPYLVVLDGLERILIAYARMDAARLADEDLDEEAGNYVAGALGLPESAAQSFVGQHRLRKTADPRAGNFLRKLTRVRNSRVLVSTRLYPAELQTVFGDPVPGSLAYFITGLSGDDALDLWRAFGVKGSRDTLLPLFRSFEKHPLLIQALASQVARYRTAPGDFDRWWADHPDFDPFSLPLVGRKSHVLAYALRGLDERIRQALHTVAGFRMPAAYDTLADLLVGDDKPFAGEKALDAGLTELEDRGLLGWDRRANRYDMHPIVRGVTWSGLDDEARQETYQTLHAHFESLPMIEDWEQVERLEDLTPAIELFNTLIGLGRYDDAFVVFRDRLERATHYRLSASRQRVELLEMLFPDGLDGLPRLSQASQQAYTLNSLAAAYHFSGQPGPAAPLLRRNIVINEEEGDASVGLSNLASALFQSGELRESEAAARRALHMGREREDRFREAMSLQWLGLTLAAWGVADDSAVALERSLRMFVAQRHIQQEGVVNSFLAQRALWLGDPIAARTLADRAWELAHDQRYESDFIRAARRQGAAELGLGDLTTADERLHHALTRARAVNLVEEELPALAALAELRRQQGDPNAARELLEDAWEPAERGPHPLLHADACNVLCQIERDAGNHDAAVEAATGAYRLAWCDGPPFAYHWGLEKARAHLAALGEPEPDDLPPYDESRYEPMPEVEIDPDPEDEFHAGE